MKLSADRLKNLDWKQFGVNHGEKIALGLVGLMVVLILAMGTRWSKFKEKDPNQLISQVEKESQALTNATWPEEQQQIYTDTYDVRTIYDNSYSVVEADNFRYPIGHPMIWPLHRRQEPIEEPTWLAVQELVQTPGRFILELPPEGQEPVADAADALKEEEKSPRSKEDAIKAQFGKKKPIAGGGMFGETSPMDIAGVDPQGMAPDFGMGPDGEYMMGGMSPGAQINARGVRFMAIRGVFPFRQQVDKVMKARNNPTMQDSEARRLVNFANFVIQRQKAKPGRNPWSDKDEDWTTLDQKVALDVLAETINYAEDVVDPTSRHFVITSPLPARLVGEWTSPFVGHPKIRTLTEQQLEIRRLLDEQLVKLKQEASTVDPGGVGGFAFAQRDIMGIQSEVMGNSSQQRMLMSSMNSAMNADGEEGFQMPGDVNWMLQSTNETPEYLLFRYFDFDVEPGVAYRYRVRLKLFNPNFNELPDNLAAESVGVGEFRDTPWSEPTPVPTSDKILPEDANFFVDEVLAAKARTEAKAEVDLFQWIPEIGTTANKIVQVQVGQFVGQPETPIDEKTEEPKDKSLLVEVLRPYESFKEEPLAMGTDDAVVDLATPPLVLRKSNTEFHADLKLKIKELKPLSQVLTVNEYGELENHNPISKAEQHARAKEYLGYEHDPWEDLKKAAEQPAFDPEMGGLEGFYDAGMGPADAIGAAGRGGGEDGSAGRGGGAGGKKGRRGANPLRRNRAYNATEPIMP